MNKWTDGKKVAVSEKRPGEYWYPVVNFRRVHGPEYRPYETGSTEWRRAANHVLASAAQTNFEKR